MEADLPAPDKAALRAQAKALGLDSIAVAPIDPPLRRDYYIKWIASGQHGGMAWMARNNDRRLHPGNVLPEARCILVCGLNYYQPDPDRPFRIAKYALGKDYHSVLLKKLKKLCAWLREQGGEQKPYVDTGPVLEKPIAAAAGLGWQGKSTIVLNEKDGTWLFLGVIFTTLPYYPDKPARDRCGTCTRCIDVCPTRAITAPYQLDATRCISYLTIEHHGSIPVEFREAIGDRVFGCDECLDVCPWNRHAQLTREAKFAPVAVPPLRETLQWDEAAFRNTFSGTPVARLKLIRWLRNACIVLGNTGNQEDIPALERICAHTDPIVAEQAQWAVRQIRKRAITS